jgi:hypothetical protein
MRSNEILLWHVYYEFGKAPGEVFAPCSLNPDDDCWLLVVGRSPTHHQHNDPIAQEKESEKGRDDRHSTPQFIGRSSFTNRYRRRIIIMGIIDQQ